METRITVLTPTYNRAGLLSRLYKSLCQQTCKEFEWVIVDDGSTDGTEDVVRGFIGNHNLFPIRYLKKPNGGKHTAVNLGVSIAKGELVFIADSDDMLVPNALQILAEEYKSIAVDTWFCGVCGLDCDLNGKVIGSGLGRNRIDASSLELRMRYGVTGDLKEVFKTTVLREFPFPEIPGEKFCPEALVWNRIARKYKLRCFNQPIYQVEYQEEGLTSNIVRIRMQSPVATMMTYAEMLDCDIPFKEKAKAAINYWRFWCCRKHGTRYPRLGARWLWAWPLGVVMHYRDRKCL